MNINNLEIGLNVIENQSLIDTPPIEQIRKNLFFINSNQNIINKINNKSKITHNEVIRINNTGAGNYYFKCESQFYTNGESFHIYYRKEKCVFITTNLYKDRFKYPWIIDNNNKAIIYLENYNNIIFTGAYIEKYEIINLCKALNCNVYIYNLNTCADNYDEFNYNYETMIAGNDKYNTFLPTILIVPANHNHYELLMPLNMKEKEYPIENYLLNNIENSKAYKISKQYNINKKDKSKLTKPIINVTFDKNIN